MSLDAEIFNDLPHYLRHELASYVMMGVVSRLRLFKHQDEGLRQLVAQYMKPVDVAPGGRGAERGVGVGVGVWSRLRLFKHLVWEKRGRLFV